jgi:hypothetical protein
MNSIENIVKNAIDLHFHVGPEVIPRKYNPYTLAKTCLEKLEK